jgi:hypothetical protein
MFRATLAVPEFGAGTESLEVALFGEDDVPWDQLAFRTIARTLRCYFLDRKLGAFPLRASTIDRHRQAAVRSGAA